MFKNLFKYDDLYESCANIFELGDVTMLRDFGPLKKGKTYTSIWVDLEAQVVKVFDSDKRTIELSDGMGRRSRPTTPKT